MEIETLGSQEDIVVDTIDITTGIIPDIKVTKIKCLVTI